MRNYKIRLDICSVYPYIKHLKLKPFDNPFPIVFLSAQDPDDACASVINDLIDILMEQEPSINMRIIARKIRRETRIDKIYSL